MSQDINVLALVKGEERYIFLFDDSHRSDALRTLAADPAVDKARKEIHNNLRMARPNPRLFVVPPTTLTVSPFLRGCATCQESMRSV